MYSYGSPHMAGQKPDDQLKYTFSSYVRIWDVALKTCPRRWTTGRSGERGSWISVLAAWHDNDDIDIYKIYPPNVMCDIFVVFCFVLLLFPLPQILLREKCCSVQSAAIRVCYLTSWNSFKYFIKFRIKVII